MEKQNYKEEDSQNNPINNEEENNTYLNQPLGIQKKINKDKNLGKRQKHNTINKKQIEEQNQTNKINAPAPKQRVKNLKKHNNNNNTQTTYTKEEERTYNDKNKPEIYTDPSPSQVYIPNKNDKNNKNSTNEIIHTNPENTEWGDL
ncbi:MAG: hypothetical protein N4A49_09165 [Marinifilaceae bacterium]|jgi:hypothetical protein|nr:hypothetical protein [Marinifilaceae bacterium]